MTLTQVAEALGMAHVSGAYALENSRDVKLSTYKRLLTIFPELRDELDGGAA